MKLLFAAAFKNRTHHLLIGFTIISMCLLTFASQMEMFALGIITKKGPTFFELFAPETNGGVLEPSDKITQTDLEKRWSELDPEGKGYVTVESASKFLSQKKSGDMIQKVMNAVNSRFDISSNVGHLAWMLVCIALFKAITLFSYRFSTKLVAIKVSKDLRLRYFEHIQSLPMSFYQQYNIGSLSSRVINDTYLISEAINACLINYIQTPFTVITTLTICFLTSWKLSLIMFLGFPLIFLPIVFLAKRVKKISSQILRKQEGFLSILIDFISGIQTVKVFAMEDFSLKKYKEHNEQLARLEQKGAKYDLSSRPIVHTIAMVFLATAILYGSYIEQMSISEVLFFCGLLYVFYEPVKKFAEENSHIQRGIAASERMFEVMNLKSHIEDVDGASELKSFEDKIEFKDVWFKYQDEWILKGLSCTINKGQTVAIVGPTGAGKSTIVQLLPRLYDIQRGSIHIDGKALTEYTQKSIRENIAYVPQRPFLFVDTVAENIAFGREFVREDVKAAAANAHADEFICRLPQGYDTELAEAGKDLSGGQQQRLTIARALVKNAPILIMDEATSSLDVVSENYIKTSIQQLHGKMTQIIIAHRLSTIEHADKIIYLEDGKKIAEGTKDELLKTCEGFQLMWKTMKGTALV